MPAKSGASHVLASAVALLLGPLVKDIWLKVVDGEDIMRAIEVTSDTLSEHPFLPAGDDVIALYLTIITVLVFVYLHGHLYHVLRHGSD